jgi:hypothetical protein
MTATHFEEPASIYIREWLTKIDLAQARSEQLHRESEPRIKAMLTQAARDRARAQNRINWSGIITSIATALAGIDALLSALINGHIL